MADVEAGATAADAAAAAPKTKKSSVTEWSKSTLLRTLRMLNMCNGIALITTGILVFLVSALSITFTTVSRLQYSASRLPPTATTPAGISLPIESVQSTGSLRMRHGSILLVGSILFFSKLGRIEQLSRR